MKTRETIPPKLVERLLTWCCKEGLVEEILGDLYEYYVELEGIADWKRNALYWFHAFNFLRPNLLKKMTGNRKLNYLGTLNLTIKLASRNFIKQKSITFLGTIALVIGSLSFHLIYLWVNNEQTMDRFHKNIDHIYITAAKFNPQAQVSPLSLSRIFGIDYNQFPSIKSTLRIHDYREDEIRFITERAEFGGKGLVVDSTFFEFFDFKLQNSSQLNILSDPQNVVISQDFAKKVFGDKEPLGELVKIRCDQKGTYQVAGVIEKIPSNSSLAFDFLIPTHSQRFWRRIPQGFILTADQFDLEEFNSRITEIGKSNERFSESSLEAIPFTSIYRERPFDIDMFKKYGDKMAINTMQFIAIVILMITLLSFVSLQTTVQVSSVKKWE